MRHIHGLLFLTLMIAAFGDPPTPVIGDCRKPSLPFTSEHEAENFVFYFAECVYQYYKLDTTYEGMPGFKRMFGGEGYQFNKSTIFEYDGRTMNYEKWSGKTVRTQNLATVISPPSDIVVVEWSSYQVACRFKLNVTLTVGPPKWRVEHTVHILEKQTFFDDDSGIRKYVGNNSTESTAGFIFASISSAADAISVALGYSDDVDDGGKYIENRIQFIFISVFCVLTIFVGACVYVFLRCVCSLG
eukprot:387925_1